MRPLQRGASWLLRFAILVIAARPASSLIDAQNDRHFLNQEKLLQVKVSIGVLISKDHLTLLQKSGIWNASTDVLKEQTFVLSIDELLRPEVVNHHTPPFIVEETIYGRDLRCHLSKDVLFKESPTRSAYVAFNCTSSLPILIPSFGRFHESNEQDDALATVQSSITLLVALWEDRTSQQRHFWSRRLLHLHPFQAVTHVSLNAEMEFVPFDALVTSSSSRVTTRTTLRRWFSSWMKHALLYAVGIVVFSSMFRCWNGTKSGRTENAFSADISVEMDQIDCRGDNIYRAECQYEEIVSQVDNDVVSVDYHALQPRSSPEASSSEDEDNLSPPTVERCTKIEPSLLAHPNFHPAPIHLTCAALTLDHFVEKLSDSNRIAELPSVFDEVDSSSKSDICPSGPHASNTIHQNGLVIDQSKSDSPCINDCPADEVSETGRCSDSHMMKAKYSKSGGCDKTTVLNSVADTSTKAFMHQSGQQTEFTIVRRDACDEVIDRSAIDTAELDLLSESHQVKYILDSQEGDSSKVLNISTLTKVTIPTVDRTEHFVLDEAVAPCTPVDNVGNSATVARANWTPMELSAPDSLQQNKVTRSTCTIKRKCSSQELLAQNERIPKYLNFSSCIQELTTIELLSIKRNRSHIAPFEEERGKRNKLPRLPFQSPLRNEASSFPQKAYVDQSHKNSFPLDRTSDVDGSRMFKPSKEGNLMCDETLKLTETPSEPVPMVSCLNKKRSSPDFSYVSTLPPNSLCSDEDSEPIPVVTEDDKRLDIPKVTRIDESSPFIKVLSASSDESSERQECSYGSEHLRGLSERNQCPDSLSPNEADTNQSEKFSNERDFSPAHLDAFIVHSTSQRANSFLNAIPDIPISLSLLAAAEAAKDKGVWIYDGMEPSRPFPNRKDKKKKKLLSLPNSIRIRKKNRPSL